MSQVPSPNISSLYVGSNAGWHLKATASARVCLRQPRARRNVLPECNCLNTSVPPSPSPPGQLSSDSCCRKITCREYFSTPFLFFFFFKASPHPA